MSRGLGDVYKRQGQLSHFYDALTEGKAEAVLAASLFHYKELEIRQVKEYLREKGISVRL